MKALLLLVACCLSLHIIAQPQFKYTITPDGVNQQFNVTLAINNVSKDTLTLKMSAWTPGYYQLLNFADNVSDFKVQIAGSDAPSTRVNRNGWKFATQRSGNIVVTYKVKATRAFVANPFVDATHAYIAPTGVFMFAVGMMTVPVSVELTLPADWKSATGLDAVTGNQHTYAAPDFDTLLDSPILAGPLEELPSFEVKGIPHRFIGYKLGEFDKPGFMNDLKKIVEASVAVIGDIPYKHYTFIAIGPGPGGIEHLNSTTFGFSADGLSTDAGRKRMYTFLAHEYFHHYNVKRIRPVELGPFNYDQENRTNMLWVSEGFTVYYDLLLARRAGLLTDQDLLDGIRARMLGYENKPGRLYQSATQASYNTWSDGPFGKKDDKTISVYDKGAILGLLLDFNIRHVTKNKKSLDDVMRTLYKEFYQEKKRGFSEQEFREVCERVAGVKLNEVFDYASTTKEIDYKKYFAFAGIDISPAPDFNISFNPKPGALQKKINDSWRK